MDDAAAIERVLAGDTGAFRPLVERHQDVVFSFLLRLVRDRDVAEDLAQETFVRAFAALAGYRGESRFRTWLIQIAVNALRDRRRSERRRPVVVSLDEVRRRSGSPVELPDPRPGDEALTRLALDERVACLERALDRLPRAYREVFLLKHVEGMPYQRIATLTGVSVGALKVRAHRARLRLREWCEDSTRRERRDARPAGTIPGR